ncbi:hypothetical protein C2S53_018747 [Perilla frutescens var. hirtella]|uniref:NB-ARC domain-containing protein n=1 Tax=Perilla frutescens var. hirtella TaxID=608512 RepID=A0AAD4P447_PERFH|nr:hypothetical protein C2S53_018747 [Perilla frutescens var. hirtella]
MAAAYAAVVSLLNSMDLVKNHPLLSTCFDMYQIESLRENLDVFQDFVEIHADSDITEEDLVRRIAVAAQMAEDIIEVEAADRIRGASSQKSPSFLPYLQKVLEEMDSIKEKLTGHDSHLQVIPIIGMGGIGKTTLARNVYEKSHIVRHFNVCVWVTVSQEFSARKIYLQALTCLGGSTSGMDKSDDQQLSHELYKILYDRRYLIVLDDVWSVEAWDKIKFFFPENNNRSRIVVTTRELKLVDYFGSSTLAIDFLDDKNSWDLFCEKTFGQQGCPSELKTIGRRIVEKCQGLPLAIVLLGGLLGKSPRTLEYWEKIEEDKSLVLDDSGHGEGNKPLEDYEIDVPKLIKFWVAEGPIKSKTGQSLEEVAESYIKSLVDRNLVLVRDVRHNKKLETCFVHDLVRDMCIRIGEKEDFYRVHRDIDGARHFIVDQKTARFYPQKSQEKPSLVHPLIFHGKIVSHVKSRLLRVLFHDMDDLDYTFRQVNLRFLSVGLPDSGSFMDTTYSLPSSISLLWSLQTIIVFGSPVVAPSEIWEMPQLRHIQMSSICLPDPPPPSDEGIFVLQNLQTLKTVQKFNFTEEVCKRIPNIKELHVDYDFDEQEEASPCYHLHNIGCLNKLESLRYSCYGWEYGGDSLQKLKLPSSLKELSLWDCHLAWSDMTMISWLPHLEILELQMNAVVGPEWNISAEEEYLCLKHLYIHGCDDLIYWNITDSSNFPVLETLSLVSLSKLEEIPSGIGEIPTLEEMHMHDCSESATISAVEILEEQDSLGNLILQLQLSFNYQTEAKMWKEKIQELGFTCQNVLINGEYYHSS